MIRRLAVALLSIASLVTFVLVLSTPRFGWGVGPPWESPFVSSQRMIAHTDPLIQMILANQLNGQKTPHLIIPLTESNGSATLLRVVDAIELVHTQRMLLHVPGRQDASIDGPEGRVTAHVAEVQTVILRVSPLLVFSLLAIYPCVVVWRGPIRRWFRRRRGTCLKCGYSLEGNVSSVCPGCGAPLP